MMTTKYLVIIFFSNSFLIFIKIDWTAATHLSLALNFVPPSAGRDTYLDWLSERITNCYNLFKKGEIVAPYLCLIQSSGYGKKRTLLELAKKNLSSYKVIVWNFKDADPGTFILHHLTCIGQIRDIETAQKSMIQFLQQWCALASDPSYHNAKRLEHSFETSSLPRDLGLKLTSIPPVAPSGKLEYLLIIDEASALVNIPAYCLDLKTRSVFQLLRKVLAKIELGIVCILADTISSISNFASRINKGVGRSHQTCTCASYRPIWFLPTVDILATHEFPFLSYPFLLQFVRPLWFSEYHTNNRHPASYMLNFAAKKLGLREYVGPALIVVCERCIAIQNSITFEMVAHTLAT